MKLFVGGRLGNAEIRNNVRRTPIQNLVGLPNRIKRADGENLARGEGRGNVRAKHTPIKRRILGQDVFMCVCSLQCKYISNVRMAC